MITETSLPNRLHKGKVRDTYDIGDGLLLMVATDRLSAFDVVLPNGILNKGLVLSRMSEFWFRATQDVQENHFLGMADDPETVRAIDGVKLPVQLSHEVARQSMVVRRARRVDIECIVRGYLAGSAWSEYKRSGSLWGRALPAGLAEGEVLEKPVFTPTTKAEEGHDVYMSPREVAEMVGQEMMERLERSSLALYEFGHNYAKGRGIILADTKMEFGTIDDRLILIDELLTPDSSRFWDAEGYEPGKSLPNFDKQYVRDWLDSQGWDREPPAPELPEEVIQRTSQRYIDAYLRLTGNDILAKELG